MLEHTVAMQRRWGKLQAVRPAQRTRVDEKTLEEGLLTQWVEQGASAFEKFLSVENANGPIRERQKDFEFAFVSGFDHFNHPDPLLVCARGVRIAVHAASFPLARPDAY
jgi:hypothetical protein